MTFIALRELTFPRGCRFSDQLQTRHVPALPKGVCNDYLNLYRDTTVFGNNMNVCLPSCLISDRTKRAATKTKGKMSVTASSLCLASQHSLFSFPTYSPLYFPISAHPFQFSLKEAIVQWLVPASIQRIPALSHTHSIGASRGTSVQMSRWGGQVSILIYMLGPRVWMFHRTWRGVATWCSHPIPDVPLTTRGCDGCDGVVHLSLLPRGQHTGKNITRVIVISSIFFPVPFLRNTRSTWVVCVFCIACMGFEMSVSGRKYRGIIMNFAFKKKRRFFFALISSLHIGNISNVFDPSDPPPPSFLRPGIIKEWRDLFGLKPI